MSTPQDSAPQPREQLPITLFDHVVLSARTEGDQIHLSLRDLCDALSLDLSSQRRRITANPSLHLTRLRVLLGHQLRVLDFLLLDDVSLWILSVQTIRVAPEVRARFNYVKTYLARFNISTYTDLPAVQVDAAIQFVKAQYHALTGKDLPAVEQTGLEGLNE
jgi:hypothetical protein